MLPHYRNDDSRNYLLCALRLHDDESPVADDISQDSRCWHNVLYLQPRYALLHTTHQHTPHGYGRRISTLYNAQHCWRDASLLGTARHALGFGYACLGATISRSPPQSATALCLCWRIYSKRYCNVIYIIRYKVIKRPESLNSGLSVLLEIILTHQRFSAGVNTSIARIIDLTCARGLNSQHIIAMDINTTCA